jgi:hypothetical protein
MDGGHVRRIRTSGRTPGKREFSSHPIDLRVMSHDPVKADVYVIADVQDKEVSHFSMATDIQSDRDILRNWTSLVRGAMHVV